MPLNRSSNFDSTGWSLLSNLHFFGSGSSTSIESPLFSELSACRLCSTELPALSAILVVYIRRTADWQIRHCQPITARVGLTFTERSRVPWRSPPHSPPRLRLTHKFDQDSWCNEGAVGIAIDVGKRSCCHSARIARTFTGFADAVRNPCLKMCAFL